MALSSLYSCFSELKNAFSLPTAKITNPDVTRLINSTEIQSVVRPANPKIQKRPWTQHKNPLRNKGVLFRLNPYAKTLRRQELRAYLFMIHIAADPSNLHLCLSQAGASQGEEGQEAREEGYFRIEGFPRHPLRSLISSLLSVTCGVDVHHRIVDAVVSMSLSFRTFHDRVRAHARFYVTMLRTCYCSSALNLRVWFTITQHD